MLNQLGRSREALTAAGEAVAIYRDLASQRPDAFRPDLAISLSAYANCLDALGWSGKAIAADVTAIVTLSPAFVARPAVLRYWMLQIVRQYYHLCERLGVAVDEALLAPIVDALQKLDSANRNKPNEL
jgi:hypothetical protein